MIACLNCESAHTFKETQAIDIEYQTVKESYDYYRCQSCNCLFIHPVPEDKLSIIYPSNYYSYSFESSKSIIYKVKDLLDRLFLSKAIKKSKIKINRILDVGGGSGWILSNIKKIYNISKAETHEVDLDINSKPIAEAQGHQFHNSRIEDFNPEYNFDLTIMFNLIEHVKSPRQVLLKIFDLLNDNGLLLIKTPNTDCIDYRLLKNKNWAGLHCPRHWVLFTKENFSALANECGFKVIAMSYTQGAYQWSATVMHLLYKSKDPFETITFKILLVLFSAIDFLRSPFSKTAQMFFILEKNTKMD